jgi:uncharacterized membrane protein YeaQ/YmgE (transglycosylase-associated protein family)
MQISNEGILVILFVGLVAGWLAGKVVRGTGLVSEIIFSAIGAVVLLLIVRLLRGRF